MILDAHTIGKHCQPRDLITDDVDGQLVVNGVNASAFVPDDDGVSVAWIEYYQGSQADQIQQALECMCRQRTVRKNHRLALFEVGTVKNCGFRCGKQLDVITDGYEGYECHSLITGVDQDCNDLMNLIALNYLSLHLMKVD